MTEILRTPLHGCYAPPVPTPRAPLALATAGVLVAALALSAPAARADDAADSATFARIDANGDGVVTEDEARAMPFFDPAFFRLLDTDHDGRVTRAEVTAYRHRLEAQEERARHPVAASYSGGRALASTVPVSTGPNPGQ